MKIGLQLYVKDSEAAVALYQKAFRTELGYNVRNPDNTFMHAELDRDGHNILSLSELQEDTKTGNTMQFSVYFGQENQEALTVAYETLKEGGQVLYPLGPCPWNACIADVIDRFGVRWYIAL